MVSLEAARQDGSVWPTALNRPQIRCQVSESVNAPPVSNTPRGSCCQHHSVSQPRPVLTPTACCCRGGCSCSGSCHRDLYFEPENLGLVSQQTLGLGALETFLANKITRVWIYEWFVVHHFEKHQTNVRNWYSSWCVKLIQAILSNVSNILGFWWRTDAKHCEQLDVAVRKRKRNVGE